MLIQKNIKRLLIAVLLVLGAASVMVAPIRGSYAQNLDDYLDESDKKYDPSDYQQWKDNFKETPVEDMAFDKDKQGCAQKMAFSSIIIKMYKSGKDAKQLEQAPILGKYMKKQYDLVKEKGVSQAQMDMMTDYQNCIKNAKVSDDESKEYDMNMRYGACNKLSTILMGTVESIKKRQSLETVLNRYGKSFPDLSGTSYSEMEDPTILIGVLYKEAKDNEWESEEEKYESLYEKASHMVLGCAS